MFEGFKLRIIDGLIKSIGRVGVFIILLLPLTLLYFSLPLLGKNSLLTILTSEWYPEDGIYGLKSFIITTLITGFSATTLSFFLALPISLIIYSRRNKLMGRLLNKIVQIMSGIPTVVYGLTGLVFLVPLIRELTESPTGLSLLAVSIVLGVVILPTMIIYISQSFNSLPQEQRVACYALGSTEIQFFMHILIPSSIRGIIIGLLMGFSRAISDTMIALMLSGNSLITPESLLESARSLTSHIALVIPGEFDGIEFKAIFFSSLLLFCLILIFNVLIKFIETREKRAK